MDVRLYWPWLALVAGWGLFNAVTRVKPETWARWGETRPRLQAFLRLMRAVGIDPPTAAAAIRDFLAGRAATVPRPPGWPSLPPSPSAVPDAADTLPETPAAKESQP